MNDFDPTDDPTDFVHPSDFECSCESRNPDDYLLSITEGQFSITHTVCDKSVDVDLDPEAWNTTESIPVRVEFVDEGMSPATPDGPAEHNGWWWDISPRKA